MDTRCILLEDSIVLIGELDESRYKILEDGKKIEFDDLDYSVFDHPDDILKEQQETIAAQEERILFRKFLYWAHHNLDLSKKVEKKNKKLAESYIKSSTLISKLMAWHKTGKYNPPEMGFYIL